MAKTRVPSTLAGGGNMTRLVQIIPLAVAVPTVDESVKALETRRRVRGMGGLTYDQKKRSRRFLETWTSRALAPFPTVRDLSNERREPLRRLALTGASVLGPNTADAVDQLVSELHADAPWLREISTFLLMHLRANIEAGETGLILPPILLVGEPGCGKSAYACRVAELADVPWRRIDVGSGSAGFRISGLEKGWANAAPGVPVETVVATLTANPVLVVDEVDKCGMLSGAKVSGTSVTVSLLEMLEPATAARFECPAYRLPFDMSRLVWIMTANSLESVPDPIRDRSHVFRVPNPAPEDLIAIFDRQTRDLDDRDLVAAARSTLGASLSNGTMSLRQLRAYIDAVRGFSSRPRFH